jgi:acetylornithine/succinyldiaminopimelate/putrescine aminotransferase
MTLMSMPRPFVWDLSGNKYLDFCCSPGPYALGAADPDVRNHYTQDRVCNPPPLTHVRLRRRSMPR